MQLTLPFRFYLVTSLAFCTLLLLSACGGGSGDGGSEDGGASSANQGCDGSCPNLALSAAEVTRIVSQGVVAAQQLGVSATFAVVDRVGNVLAVYRMPGASANTRINGQIGASGGLEGRSVPATLAAISKAGTGAYLSSQGNAFSTRTASQIIQENFNPGERNQPGGPLFGVQFSQLLCSDVTVLDSAASAGLRHGRALATAGSIGPRPLPLGLSADPGGFPLYKAGDLVGGIGVEFDGLYSLDRDVTDYDEAPEERIALSATLGFEAPSERVASNMSVGKFLRYSDTQYSDLSPLPEIQPNLDSAGLSAVVPFFAGSIKGGVQFGKPASGVASTVRAGVPAAVLVDGGGTNRFPARAGSAPASAAALTATEVEAILDSALVTAQRARAAIRRPLDTAARVSIWVVDVEGRALGFTRSQDAPVFGIDVALQKARTAAFFSTVAARSKLISAGLGKYVSATDALTAQASFDGSSAITSRAIGNLARPFFVDGINENSNGPLSLPFPSAGGPPSWSPFNTGLQLDLVFSGLARSLGLLGAISSVPDSCAESSVFGGALANGIQIFPGSVPLYRGSTLIGAIGVSGDGIDQDDLVAFYGASREGLNQAGHPTVGDARYGFNAPEEIRSDLIPIQVENVRLRYVSCPEAPFSGDNSQNVCESL